MLCAAVRNRDPVVAAAKENGDCHIRRNKESAFAPFQAMHEIAQ